MSTYHVTVDAAGRHDGVAAIEGALATASSCEIFWSGSGRGHRALCGNVARSVSLWARRHGHMDSVRIVHVVRDPSSMLTAETMAAGRADVMVIPGDTMETVAFRRLLGTS